MQSILLRRTPNTERNKAGIIFQQNNQEPVVRFEYAKGVARVHILVVDDERIIADTLGLILKGRGFDATVTYSGEDALKIAEILRPDVLLSDVVLAGMNGIELALSTLQSWPSCKVILFSGDVATTKLLNDAEVQGYHFEVLAKPVQPQDLLDCLVAPG